MDVRHHIVIIGGYGNTGRRVAQRLASRADVQLTLAGRSLDRAVSAAAALERVAAHPVRGAQADMRDARARRALCEGATLVLAASSTTEYAADIARDAVAAGADAFDTNLSMPAKLAALEALAPEIVRSGRTVITDGGFHPGLPGAMARRAAQILPELTDAHIGGSFNIDWRGLEFSDASATEFVDELRHMNPESLVQGRWVRSWSRVRPFVFGGAIGRRQCAPWAMQEMRELPAAIPTLRNAGFFVAGFSPFIDYVVMPAAFAALWCAPRARATIGRGFVWALRHFTPRGTWAVLQLEATASGGARLSIRVAHDDGYELTAMPVVAAVEQLLDGPRRPGMFTQAGFVEPALFLQRLEGLGVQVHVQVAE
jgi:saccharopine dehydrogenase (NAD+, L-lysine-forming)